MFGFLRKSKKVRRTDPAQGLGTCDLRKSKTSLALPEGCKVVAPPADAGYRRLLESDDLTTSGGTRTMHGKPSVVATHGQ